MAFAVPELQEGQSNIIYAKRYHFC
uniref:Uncharacterized protein n=1 Tax=Arundo donax TaxID=35708 RepID=A0A0A8YN42_ARUDO